MHGNIPAPDGGATNMSETNFSRRQFFAEPLWFAVMCRGFWGANAWKELRFRYGESYTERTYRGWASGDNEPPARVLGSLILGGEGRRVIDRIMDAEPPKWWHNIREDERQADIFRRAMREVSQQD